MAASLFAGALLAVTFAATAWADYNVIAPPPVSEEVRVQFNRQAPGERSEWTREYLQEEERKRLGVEVKSKDISTPVGFDDRRRLPGSELVRPSGGDDTVTWAKRNWRALCAGLFVVGACFWFVTRR